MITTEHACTLARRLGLLARHQAARAAYRAAAADRGASWETRADLQVRMTRLRDRRIARAQRRESFENRHAAEHAFRGPGRLNGR